MQTTNGMGSTECLECCVMGRVPRQGELKLTMLLTWEPSSCLVQVHVSPLPARPRPPVKVQVSRCLAATHVETAASATRCVYSLRGRQVPHTRVVRSCDESTKEEAQVLARL